MTTANANGASLSPSTTVGSSLRASPAVRAALRTLSNEVRAASSLLTDVRPPNAGLKESYDALLKRAADVRGRGLLYPYIGSGIGNGALVELSDGSVKWDLICGIGVHFFGHSDPDLVEESLVGSLDDTLKNGNLQTNFDAVEFAEVLVGMARKTSRLKYSYISTSGAMANENALKVCYQKHAPASRVIAFADCFMGRSVTMCQIGDTAEYRQGVPLSTLVDYMPFFDQAQADEVGLAKYIDRSVWRLNQLLDRYPNQHACFIFEMMQGEGGFNVGNRDHFKALMDVCKARRVAVWDDEIQTFGRSHRMFAYEHFDLGDYVDVFCVGKMTQACVTLFTEEYNPKPGLLSGTFTGEGPSFRVGRRILEKLRDGAGEFYGEGGSFARHHAAFREQVAALKARRPEWFPRVVDTQGYEQPGVGGVGGMMKFTPFGGRKDKVTAACRAIFEEGAVVFYCGHNPYHIRMLPPLPAMKVEDWPRIFAVIERGLAKAAT
jgi:4-aminobutyrate aminotransferase-like enzyme